MIMMKVRCYACSGIGVWPFLDWVAACLVTKGLYPRCCPDHRCQYSGLDGKKISDRLIRAIVGIRRGGQIATMVDDVMKDYEEMVKNGERVG